LAILIVGVWILRGVILSGYLFYPAYKLGALDVSWRVPRAIAMSDYNSMQQWARFPGNPPESPLGNWRWINAWYDREFGYWRRLGTPLTVAGGAVLLAIATLFTPPRRAWRTWLILLPPVAATLFWFVTMPVYRYLGSTLWCLAAGAAVLALAQGERRAAAMGIALVAMVLSFESVRIAQWTPATAFEKVPNWPGEPYETGSGLWIHKLHNLGTQAWDSDLLETSTATSQLRQRVPGELCKGFMTP
jgi:hypothetical protein